MPHHLKKFSTYQKNAIKDLTRLLGDRPFLYEKTGNNHLQVKIQGIERVFHTSSTPSDYKSLLNFIGDVKAELNRLEQEKPSTAAETTESPPSNVQPGQEPSQEVQIQRMAQTIIKSIRMNFDRIKDREYSMFFEQETPDAAQIAQFRADFVESEFAKAMKNKKDTDYFTKAAIKKGKEKVMEHLDFMLPTPAYYHEQLKQHFSKQRANPDAEQAAPEPKLPAQTIPEQAVIEQASAAVENKKVVSLDDEATGSVSSSFVLADLMKEKSPKRIRLLKTLPKNHLTLLIEDLKVALEQKHQEDIQQLVQLMQEKGIELTELQQAVQN